MAAKNGGGELLGVDRCEFEEEREHALSLEQRPLVGVLLPQEVNDATGDSTRSVDLQRLNHGSTRGRIGASKQTLDLAKHQLGRARQRVRERARAHGFRGVTGDLGQRAKRRVRSDIDQHCHQ